MSVYSELITDFQQKYQILLQIQLFNFKRPYNQLFYSIKMAEFNIEELSILHQSKHRGFICPCGKSYLSNAALYTHIKQKHNGNPPGQISKPNNYYFKRGRPVSKVNAMYCQNQKFQRNTTSDEYQQVQKVSVNSVKVTGSQLEVDQIISGLCAYLKTKPNPMIKKYLLNQIQAFVELSVHLRMSECQKAQNGIINLADGVSQFLKQVCHKVQWQIFQHVFVFFMIFLQYLMDEFNDKSLLCEAPLDITCQYVNSYIQDNMKEMSDNYQLSYLWIFEQDCSLQIFSVFFKWMTAKNYSQYKISLQKQLIGIQNSYIQKQLCQRL